MALPTPALVPGGRHHATTTGTVDAGAGEGQVPAIPGVNQPMFLSLTAFAPLNNQVSSVLDDSGQIYFTVAARTAGVDDVRQDPVTPFDFDASGVPIRANFRVDITASGDLFVLIEPHHSAGR